MLIGYFFFGSKATLFARIAAPPFDVAAMVRELFGGATGPRHLRPGA